MRPGRRTRRASVPSAREREIETPLQRRGAAIGGPSPRPHDDEQIADEGCAARARPAGASRARRWRWSRLVSPGGTDSAQNESGTRLVPAVRLLLFRARQRAGRRRGFAVVVGSRGPTRTVAGVPPAWRRRRDEAPPGGRAPRVDDPGRSGEHEGERGVEVAEPRG